MLLETLDLRRNDVVIFSQNKFNFNDNFKVIFKNEKVKKVKSISYFDVCSIVKNPSPKNLIVYRLLTNVNHMDAYSSKYGYFIQINNRAELIYFDPIYAIKDLRHLRFDLDPEKFRFKIQQVGLTSLTKKEDDLQGDKVTEASFAEVYSFDLKAVEAQHQNDKIFADAIFALDDLIEESEQLLEENINQSFKGNNPYKKDLFERVPSIAEDHSFSSQMNRVAPPQQEKIVDIREEIVDLLKQALGIQGSEGFNFQQAPSKQTIENHKTENNISREELKQGLLDLFKSSSKPNEATKSDRDSVILRFKADE